MVMYGADVDQLRQFADRLEAAGASLDAIAAQLNARIAGTHWEGPDGVRFMSEWSRSYRPGLIKAGDYLAAAGKRIRVNAQDQEQASRGGSRGGPIRGALPGILSLPWPGFRPRVPPWWGLPGPPIRPPWGDWMPVPSWPRFPRFPLFPNLPGAPSIRMPDIWGDMVQPMVGRTYDILSLGSGYVDALNGIRLDLGLPLGPDLLGKAGSNILSIIDVGTGSWKIGDALADGNWDQGIRGGIDVAWGFAGTHPIGAAIKGTWDISYEIGDAAGGWVDNQFDISGQTINKVVNEHYGGELSVQEATELSHRYDGPRGFGRWVMDML